MIRPIAQLLPQSGAHILNPVSIILNVSKGKQQDLFVIIISVTAMIQQLNWPTLEQRRYEAKAIMMYKILTDLVQVNHNDLVYNSSVTCGHSLRLLHLPTRVDVYQYLK